MDLKALVEQGANAQPKKPQKHQAVGASLNLPAGALGLGGAGDFVMTPVLPLKHFSEDQIRAAISSAKADTRQSGR